MEFRPPDTTEAYLALPPFETGSRLVVGTLEDFHALRGSIAGAQSREALEQSFDRLLNFQLDGDPNNPTVSNASQAINWVFRTGARLEAAGEPCAPMIAQRFRMAVEREIAGEPNPHLYHYMNRTYQTLMRATRTDHTQSPEVVRGRDTSEYNAYDSAAARRRHEEDMRKAEQQQALCIRLLDSMTQQGLVADELYVSMLQSPLNTRSTEVLVMLGEQLADESGTVLDTLRSQGFDAQIKALQNTVNGALQTAIANPARNTELLQPLVDALVNEKRPEKFPLYKLIQASNLIVESMKEKGLAPPDLSSGRELNDVRNVGQALALILRAGRLWHEAPEVKAQLDLEDELFVDIADAIAFGISASNMPEKPPMTVGDLIMRYPDATPKEIQRMLNAYWRTGRAVRRLEGGQLKYKRYRDIRPGYGRYS